MKDYKNYSALVDGIVRKNKEFYPDMSILILQLKKTLRLIYNVNKAIYCLSTQYKSGMRKYKRDRFLNERRATVNEAIGIILRYMFNDEGVR